MEKEYPALSVISKIFKIIGIIFIVLSIISLIVGLSWINNYQMKDYCAYMIFGSIVSGFVLSLPWFAFAELIKLFIRIEINTRNKSDSINYDTQSTSSYSKNENNMNSKISYEDWRVTNPNKTINDYYAAMKKSK